MKRTENISLTVQDLHDAVLDYVRKHYPEYEGKVMRAGMYPGHAYIGSFTDIREEDKDKSIITVAVEKD